MRNKTKKMHSLSEVLDNNIFNFYCFDKISSVGSSMKDTHICGVENNTKIKDAS